MNKELEALQEVRQQLTYYKEYAKEKLPTKAEQIDASCEDELNIIETALKDYATRKTLIETIDSGEMVFEERNVWEEKQKKIKAFEIIKDKKVDVGVFRFCESANDYNRAIRINENGLIHYVELTQEEYELLKEVLL